ncbi:MAG TPA: hypothetical protein VFG50_08870, partial [Rhodothermales bacterium]|nr:hypothetical protein [Rhodothermales bacterium]
MSSIIKRGQLFSIQYHDANRRPARKFVASKLTVRRDVEALKRKLDRDYALGEFDPWVDDPFTYDLPEAAVMGAPKTIGEALALMLAEKKAEGKRPDTLDT